MKQIGLEKAILELCINEAQRERVILTRMGKPIALIVGLEEMEKDYVNLCCSNNFWKLITTRRKQKTITREELEEKLRTIPRCGQSDE